MKAMKKYFKVVLAFIAFTLCSFMLVFSPTLSAQALVEYSLDEYKLAFNAIEMPTSTVDASNGEFLIPVPSFDNTNGGAETDYTDITVRVYDTSGSVAHDYIIKTSEEGKSVGPATGEINFFKTGYVSKNSKNYIKVTSLNNGSYKIVYILKNTTQTFYSKDYEVTVYNATSYSLDMEKDSTADGFVKLIPSQLKTETEQTIPYAYVTKEDGSYVSGAKLKPIVYLDNEDAEEGVDYTLEDANGVLKFTPKAEGNFTLKYSYKYGTNYPTKEYEILVSNDFVAPKPSDLKQVSVPDADSFKFELGDKDISLEGAKLTLSNGLSNNVSYNTASIVIQKKFGNKNIKLELEPNTYTFDMTLEAFKASTGDNTLTYADLVGDYQIIFNLVDAYGNEFTNASDPIVIENVNISSKPTAYFSYEYATDDLTNVNKNGTEIIKKEYGYSEVILPALYAEDKVTSYNDNDNFILIRYLKRKSDNKYFYIDNLMWDDSNDVVKTVTKESHAEGYNYSTDASQGANKIATFTFTDPSVDENQKTLRDKDYAGDYILEYVVISKTAGKIRTTELKSSTITVLETSTAPNNASVPTVTLTNDETRVRDSKGFEITFTSKDSTDNELSKIAFYYQGSKTKVELKNALDNALNDIKEEVGYHLTTDLFQSGVTNRLETILHGAGFTNFKLVTLKDNKYTIAESVYGEYTIGAMAINDYGNTAVDSMSVYFVNAVSDKIAPDYEIETTKYAALDANKTLMSNGKITSGKIFKTGDTIILPTLNFTDNIVKTLWTTNVRYYIETPEMENGGVQYLRPDNSHPGTNGVIIGGEITAGKTGVYTVVYSAMDEAGNVTVVYFTFNVVSKANPVISFKVTGEDVTNTGNSYEVEANQQIRVKTTMTDVATDTDVTKDSKTKLNVKEIKLISGNASYDIVDGAYVFYGNGTFKFELEGSYDSVDAIGQVFTIKVVEETKLEWKDSKVFDTIPTYEKVDQDVLLPYITTNMSNAVVTVKVTLNGKDIECTPVASKGDDDSLDAAYSQYWTFHTDANEKKAVYKVTYTAVTSSGKKVEKTVDIKVGDNVAPTISISNASELTKDVVYDGTNAIDFKFSVSPLSKVFKVTLNGVEYKLNMVVSDNSADGEISWQNVKYKLVKNGVTKADNDTTSYSITETGTYTIEITAEDGNSNISKAYKINFKVVVESDAKESKDSVVGVVLIILSLVVLAGVIIFFLVTGKTSGGNKTKSSKTNKDESKSNNKPKTQEVEAKVVEEVKTEARDVKDEAKVEEPKEEIKDESAKAKDDNNDETKTGEVE